MNHLKEDSNSNEQHAYKTMEEHMQTDYSSKQSNFPQMSSPPTSPSSFNSSMSPTSASLDENSSKM